MHTRLLDSAVFQDPDHALDFVGNVLEASTEYSIVGTDLSGTIRLWNRGASREYGYEPDEVIGKASLDLLHSSTDLEAQKLDEMMAGAVSSGKWEGTLDRVRKGGAVFAAHVVLTPRRGDAGEPVGYLLISKDLSQEDHLPGEVEDAEDRFRGLLDSASGPMLIVDRSGRIVLTNTHTESLFGYARDELAGRDVEILIPERYPRRHPQHPKEFFREPTVRPPGAGLGLWGRRQDGEQFPVEVSLSPLESRQGVVAIAAIRDVTERKRAEEKFRAMLETASDPMVIVDKRGEIVLANAQTEKLFGYSPGALVGSDIEVLIPARSANGRAEVRDQLFSDPRAPFQEGLDLRGRREDGTEFPVEISLSPLETEEGVLAIAAIRDVSDRKASELELRETNVQLEDASDAKDNFLASMSHELRTPLNAILGFTGTMLMEIAGPLTDEQRKQLETVQSNGWHLLSIINDLLDLARVESGTLEVEHEPVDCRALLEEVVAGLRPLADQKGLDLEISLPPGDAVVATDRRSLKQILINLTNNAIKFTDEGGVGLELTLNGGQRPGPCFSVSDSGIGIDPGHQEALFKAFRQAGSGATRYDEGTGLGLYISRRLASFIGGELDFESKHGEGSTFFLQLNGGG